MTKPENFKSIIPLLILFLLLSGTSMHSRAQSVVINTENEAARACYMEATVVSTAERVVVSSRMIEPCNVAIEQYGLTPEIRAASFANRGILHAAQGELAEALSDYESALAINPELGEVYVSRGMIYHFEQQYERAIENYSRAIELDVSNAHIAHFDRGVAYEELNRLEEAASDYRQALVISPEWAPASSRLHWVTEKLDRRRDAGRPTPMPVPMP